MSVGFAILLSIIGALAALTIIAALVSDEVAAIRDAGRPGRVVAALSTSLGVGALVFLRSNPELHQIEPGDVPVALILVTALLIGPLYWLPIVAWVQRRRRR